MSVPNVINSLTAKLKREIDDVDGPMAESDPEIWEHALVDEIDDIKKYKPVGSSQEMQDFRELYTVIKKIVNEALAPSDLMEAGMVIKYQIADTLNAIAKKNPAVAAEILGDLKNEYIKSDNEDLAAMAKSVARKIEKNISLEAAQASAFNAAAGPGAQSSSIAGKNIVFTGTLSLMTRDKATELATQLGAHVTGSVSKKTDILVVGEDAGSKRDKAAALGVKIITEAEWQEMTRSGIGVAVHGIPEAIPVMKTLSFRKP